MGLPAAVLSPTSGLSQGLASLPPHAIAGFPLLQDAGRVVGRYFKCQLQSAFETVEYDRQPARLASLMVSGPQEQPIPAERLFALAAGEDALLRLDRLCRLMHALNHFCIDQRKEWLILPVHQRLFDYVREGHGRAFASLLGHFGLSPERVVLALPLVAFESPQSARMLASFRSHGFRIGRRVQADGRVIAIR
ncbi:hypothetical protein [Parachitinimonas caeni]|uniref:Uncharacterized protein n=1 Tax=Parachitinimonas caeni TaxID=3031301 RepID=A0ABT7DSZ4_9NEIS|nr:hypothetical protein [Parachitinimonas caeni]MDK2123197.1 hypothetical protein [Parachitinimonas caeni]